MALGIVVFGAAFLVGLALGTYATAFLDGVLVLRASLRSSFSRPLASSSAPQLSSPSCSW
jgi:hypothetical protein